MDRVDKVLLVLPLLPVADLLSTLFALGRGGQEVGILARLVLEQCGAHALVPLAASASAIFLVFMLVVVHVKRLFVEEWRVKWTRRVLLIPVYWLFILQGVYVSTVVMNLLVPLSPALAQVFVLRVALVGLYFAGVSMFTIPHMRQLPNQ